MTSIHDPDDPVPDPTQIDHDREFDDHDRDLEHDPETPAGRPAGGAPQGNGTDKSKKRGRPSKPRTCNICKLEKLSSDFRYGSAYCKACGHESQLAYQREQAAKREAYRAAGQAGRAQWPSKREDAVQKVIKEHRGLEEFKHSFAQFVLPTCCCCRETRDVTADPIGAALLCPICLFQIVRCGRCVTHASREFYPQLAVNEPIDVPAELLHAYGFKTSEELRAESEAAPVPFVPS